MPLPSIILPGYLARASEYLPLKQDLESQGIPTEIVPLRKRDWLPTVGGRSMIPILKAIDDTVKATLTKYNASHLNLIAHSAGGWIARIYLGEKPYTIHNDVTESEGVWNAHNFVSTLVCLGTPHFSGEYWTKRNLNFVNDNYPGAFYPHVKYVCVAGKAIYCRRRFGSWIAYNSYQLTCGDGNTWGDGITPIVAAHLDGAINLTLDNVTHAPNPKRLWYGSPEAQKKWLNYLCD